MNIISDNPTVDISFYCTFGSKAPVPKLKSYSQYVKGSRVVIYPPPEDHHEMSEQDKIKQAYLRKIDKTKILVYCFDKVKCKLALMFTHTLIKKSVMKRSEKPFSEEHRTRIELLKRKYKSFSNRGIWRG